MSKDPTFLDVEDEEQRQQRIGTLLERLDTTSPSRSSTIPNPLNVRHEHSPGPVEPPAKLLARIQAFLPAISASNEALSQRNPADIDIENIAEDEEQYIEMDLGLGVFEAKRHPDSGSSSPHSSDEDSTSDVTSSESESDSDVASGSGLEEEDSDSSFDDDYDDSDAGSRSGSSVDMKPISSRPIKPLPSRVSQQTKLEHFFPSMDPWLPDV